MNFGSTLNLDLKLEYTNEIEQEFVAEFGN